MTTSQKHLSLTEILDGKTISAGTIEYFRARLQSRLHQLVLDKYAQQEDKGLNQAELARRIGKKPDVINRLLGSPGNWTVNTVSDLLLGMGAELDSIVADLKDKAKKPEVTSRQRRSAPRKLSEPSVSRQSQVGWRYDGDEWASDLPFNWDQDSGINDFSY